MIFTKDNLRTYMRTQWEAQGETLEPNQRLGIEISELVEHSQTRNAAIEAPFIDLWVAVLDELNSWLVSLQGTVYVSEKRGGRILNDFERSVVMTLFKLISDTTAMRHLITLGFDGSARTLMRSIAEYIQLLVALLDDPALAAEFVTADTPETSNDFYFRHLARGKLHKRVEAAWARFFSTADNAAQFFADQHRQFGKVLSGTTHPSFAGGFLSVLDFIEAEPGEIWLGHWGAKSNLSIATIHIYTNSILPLLLLSHFPFESYEHWLDKQIVYDPTNEMHRHVKLGRVVLSSLVLSLSKESNFPYIFPEGLEPDVLAEPEAQDMKPPN